MMAERIRINISLSSCRLCAVLRECEAQLCTYIPVPPLVLLLHRIHPPRLNRLLFAFLQVFGTARGLTLTFTPDQYVLDTPFTFTYERTSSDPQTFQILYVADDQTTSGPTIDTNGQTSGTIDPSLITFPGVG
jgi:hypothetical protein